eukprot:232036-Amphidinium_carterae.1
MAASIVLVLLTSAIDSQNLVRESAQVSRVGEHVILANNAIVCYRHWKATACDGVPQSCTGLGCKKSRFSAN